MGDFTQLQQKYAGTGENWNVVIIVIFRQHAASIYGFVRLFICMLRYVMSKQILEHF